VTQHALLNDKDHRDLRVITRRGAAYGDDAMYTPTFPAEFRSIQAHFPIVFAKSREGTFNPLALFGFRDRQNLFLQGDRWDTLYLPMMVERLPFLIGNSKAGKVIHIDLDSPRVSRTEGELLFREAGGNTEYLERVGSMLAAIDEGMSATPAFIAALLEHDLLESFALDIDFNDGTQNRFAGFHTVQEERLAQLGAEALGKLNQSGFLLPIYMVVASLSNFRGMIDRANRLNAADR